MVILTNRARSDGPRENLTLTDAELEACDPVPGEGGTALRGLCPFHGSDRQRSLRVNLETGHFKCFACDAWGYLRRHRDARRVAHGPRPTAPEPAPARPRRPAAKPTPPPPAPRPELADVLAGYRDALPGSPGADYLRTRGIPLDLARACGVGYAAPGAWAHRDETGRPLRDWHRGRLVFPHTDPAGNLVNLYGRAVGDAPKEQRHDHLPGPKGCFNAPALVGGAGPVAVCEGAFDALALMAAGLGRAVAIFGASGWRWAWAREVGELVFALDADATGQDAWRGLARAARLRGKRVAFLPPEAYGGRKDVAEAWAAGVLRIGDRPFTSSAEPEFVAVLPDALASDRTFEIDAFDAPEVPSRRRLVPPLSAPTALALGLAGTPADEAAQLATALANEGPEDLAAVRKEALALASDDPERAIWLAAIAEAAARRRTRAGKRTADRDACPGGYPQQP